MFAALLDLACPRRCAGCGERGVLLCGSCTGAVLGRAVAADPTPRPAGLPPVFAATAYDGPARAALIAFKERGRIALAGPLGAALAGVVAAIGADAIVSVPSSRSARHARGYDHVALLAKRATAGTGTLVLGGLEQRRRVADQSGLDAAGRAGNIAGSMSYAVPRGGCPPGLRVVLVDDIVTSGATLAEAARALRAAGIGVRACAVVAATRRRHAIRNRDSLGP